MIFQIQYQFIFIKWRINFYGKLQIPDLRKDMSNYSKIFSSKQVTLKFNINQELLDSRRNFKKWNVSTFQNHLDPENIRLQTNNRMSLISIWVYLIIGRNVFFYVFTENFSDKKVSLNIGVHRYLYEGT